jgi:trk system potassium uptake protein TrkH
MNYRFVVNQLGLLLVVLSAVLCVVGLWQMVDQAFWVEQQEQSVTATASMKALLFSAAIGLLVGTSMWAFGYRSRNANIGRREAILLVAISWIIGATLSAMPLWLWTMLDQNISPMHPFQEFVNCYFEAMSGLTTTGASVLGSQPNDIESLPRGLLLWRSVMHWLGGLGIIVLFVAVLPSVGVGGKRLFQIEAAGPSTGGVRPRIKEMARALWILYLILTGLQIAALLCCGLSMFDATCHALATISTGGFSTHNASIGSFAYGNGTAVNIVMICFMVLGGVNFGLYGRWKRGGAQAIWRDVELRAYVAMIVVGSIVVIGALMMAEAPIHLTTGQTVEPSVARSVEHGLFAVASVQTTTGFGTADYNVWPFVSKSVLVAMMFIGGCAGSTAGGIKVVRVWLAFRMIYGQLEKVIRPNVIRPVKMGGKPIDTELKIAALVYVIGIIFLALLGSFLVMLFELGRCDFVTAASASIASLFSIGPGLGAVGPVENYGWMSSASKLLLSMWMLLGRLEVLPVLALLVPRFWKRP